jgi:hypothetical protein
VVVVVGVAGFVSAFAYDTSKVGSGINDIFEKLKAASNVEFSKYEREANAAATEASQHAVLIARQAGESGSLSAPAAQARASTAVVLATAPGQAGAMREAMGSPPAQGAHPRYRVEVSRAGEVVIDQATCLVWQKSGSEAEVNWTEAKSYIEALNGKHYAGYSDWRLPQMKELVSVLEPEIQKQNRLYIDPSFDTLQQTTWSADANKDDIEFVDFYEGAYASKDRSDFNFVRAVRGSYCEKDAAGGGLSQR